MTPPTPIKETDFHAPPRSMTTREFHCRVCGVPVVTNIPGQKKTCGKPNCARIWNNEQTKRALNRRKAREACKV